MTLTRDSLTLVYVVGYAIHKLGQLDNYCIDCYSMIVNPSSSAKYLRLIRNLGKNRVKKQHNGYENIKFLNKTIIFICTVDRGGLKYPAECVAGRFWTIHIFFKKLLPDLRNCSKIVDDLVAYLTPKMAVCPEFRCSADGKHSSDICKFMLKTFLKGCLRTEEKKTNLLLAKKPIVENKPERRNVLRLQK